MRPATRDLPKLADFPFQTSDKLRYGDTDRQGHINNAVFSTFLETGRVDLLMNPKTTPLNATGTAFVIASLNLNFLAEINWPGDVRIGSGILKIGNSSLTLRQAVFQEDKCTATAETVLVQMNDTTRKSQPLSVEARAVLERYRMDSQQR